jgi:hypothetical protein
VVGDWANVPEMTLVKAAASNIAATVPGVLICG